MIYKDIYSEGVTRLEEVKITDAKLDARLLLELACGTDANTLFAHPEREVTPKEYDRFDEYIRLRCGHIPLQHISGHQEFMGLDFVVNENVLIPRQDTEFLVEEALVYVEDGMALLDMCTGSGCILLSVMNYKNGVEGVGCDISRKALEVAKQNAESLGITAQFFEGNMFDALCGTKWDAGGDNQHKFDVILSNPPYISHSDIDGLEDEVKYHDPLTALDGGTDGLDFYRRIAADAGKFLTNYGKLFLEIGYDQAQSVPAILQSAGFENIEVKKDYAGNYRVVKATYIAEA